MSTFLIALSVLAGAMSLRAELTTVSPSVTTAAVSGTESVKVDNNRFVDQIKNSLRKNNDDYVAIDLHRPNKLNNEIETRRFLNNSEGNALPLDVIAIPNISVRTGIAVGTNITNFRSFSIEPVRMIEYGQGIPTPRDAMAQQPIYKSKASIPKTPIDEEDRKSRVENWKRLLDKNKRLRMYTSTAKIEPTSFAEVHPEVVTDRSRARTPSGFDREKSKKYPRRNTKGGRNRPVAAVLKLRTVPSGRAPPNADQLDMAPARGAYIHDLRVKNLFCHRNVLWPEGPKYDSRGNTVMPPFDPKLYKHAGRSFVDTTKALFVLPRCCNCCRKSVLGCQ